MSNERDLVIEKKIDREIAGAMTLHNAAGAVSIIPKTLTDVMEFAKMMAISGPCVRPQFRGNPGACLAIALQAFRTGADPFAVANKAYITKSRSGDEQIAYEAQYIHAVLNNSGKLSQRLRAEYSGEGTKRKCRIIGYVVGEEEPLEYESPTIESIAVKNSPLWVGDPDQQLFYYSSRAWGRRHLPEVLLGMYTPDEIRGEIIDISPEESPAAPTRAQFLQQQEENAEVQRGFDNPATPPLQPSAEPAEPIGYSLALADGTFKTYGAPISAQAALIGEIQERAKLGGFAGIAGAWEDNRGLVEALEVDGHSELVKGLREAYMAVEQELREKLTSVPKAASSPAAQQVGGQLSPAPADSPVTPAKREEVAQNATAGSMAQSGDKTTAPVKAGADQPPAVALPRFEEIRYGPGRGVNWRLTVEKIVEQISTLTSDQMMSWRQVNDRLLQQMNLSWKDGVAKVNQAFADRSAQLK